MKGKYRPWNDFGDLPCYSKGQGWLQQLHIYTHPFYYIVYCLARAVSLQILGIFKSGGWDKAFAKYQDICACGGRHSFAGMLRHVKLSSPFEPGAMEKAAKAAEEYLIDSGMLE